MGTELLLRVGNEDWTKQVMCEETSIKVMGRRDGRGGERRVKIRSPSLSVVSLSPDGGEKFGKSAAPSSRLIIARDALNL